MIPPSRAPNLLTKLNNNNNNNRTRPTTTDQKNRIVLGANGIVCAVTEQSAYLFASRQTKFSLCYARV
jgi:hypothetical protein